MRFKIITLLALAVSALLLVSAVSLYAGTGKRLGTSGAMELLVPVGSKGTALAANYTAGVSGIEAMAWNPAGMANTEKGAELLASRMNYIADINLNYIGVQAKFEKLGVVGFSLRSMDFGDIPVTTSAAPDGTGEMYSPSYVTLGASLSRAMTDRIFFGATVKMVNETIMETSASGVSFDFGVQYAAGNGIRLGVVLRNIGTSMRFSGGDLERDVDLPGYVEDPIARNESLSIISQQFEMPTTLDMGISYTLTFADMHNVTVMGNFMNHHFGFDRYGAALEYSLSINNFDVALRGGASLAHDVEEGKFLLMDDQNIFGPSFGAGFEYQAAQRLSVGFDYAYQLTERFDNLQWLTLTLGF